MMKCVENMYELDYYSEIVDYYEITEGNDFSSDTEDYVNHSYIRLMNEVKNKKNLQDAADIADVAKNSIILILNLFDKKCKISSEIPLENLPEVEKKKVRKALLKILDDLN